MEGGGKPKKSKTLDVSKFLGVLIISPPKYRSTTDQLGLGTARGDGLQCAGMSFSFEMPLIMVKFAGRLKSL